MRTVGGTRALGKSPSRCSLKDTDPNCILHLKASNTYICPVLNLLVLGMGGRGWEPQVEGPSGWGGESSLWDTIYLNKGKYIGNAL